MHRQTAPTMARLAKLAGVSISTVSRALAGNPLIAEATRNHILELAKSNGFAPNQAARNLRNKRTDTIGVVLPLGHQADQHLTDPFFMLMIGHLADAIAEQGYDMLLRRVVPTSDDWLDRLIGSRRTDGLIVLGQSDQHDILNASAEHYAPMVVWGAQLPGTRYTVVGSDNREGGRMAARHLIEQGRRRLLFLGNPEPPEFRLRQEGFREICEQHADVTLACARVDLVPETVEQQLPDLLHGLRGFDGVFAASDLIAMIAISVLERSGVAIPADVAVIGYDNVSMASFGARSLTTVDQHLAQGAITLVRLLQQKMNGLETISHVSPPDLIVRSSA
jgi:DNA-binding LacI/PurR family transcriptional regulator